MTMTYIDKLKDIISRYWYGQYNILEDDIRIQINPAQKKVAIRKFYRHDANTLTGTCSELMNAAYRPIRMKYPEYKILCAEGNDPKYFPCEGFTHHFLVIQQTGFIVDPSFGIVQPISKSGYTVRRILKNKDTLFPRDLIMRNNVYVPLCIAKDGTLIGLAAFFKYDSALGIVAHTPNKKFNINDLMDSGLEEKLREPEAMPFIEKLRSVNVEETFERLNAD